MVNNFKTRKAMRTLVSKNHVSKELEKAGILICRSRTIGPNCFNLIAESYNQFTVNAKAGTEYNKVKEFTQQFLNVTILIDQ